jgi:GntR family transcriptional regulator, transcriptional repressor for pyruvate dehydrogenase complex
VSLSVFDPDLLNDEGHCTVLLVLDIENPVVKRQFVTNIIGKWYLNPCSSCSRRHARCIDYFARPCNFFSGELIRRDPKPIALVQSLGYCTDMNFEPVKGRRIFEEVSRQIEDQIQSGKLKAGTKLPNERELSATFEVSRHAVREALRSLESIGHLEFRKGAKGGAFVAKDNPQPFTKIMRGMVQIGGVSLEQLTEARLTIESAVITTVCKREDVDLRQLEANVEAAEKQTAAGKMQEKTALNVEFHLLLADLTENPILKMTMRALMNILLDVIQEVGSVMGIDVIKSRRRFLKHLRNRDSAGAVREMERHLNVLHEHYVLAASKKLKKLKGGVSGYG